MKFLAVSLALVPACIASPIIPSLFARQDIVSPYNSTLPNVTIFATGGTIASQGTSNTQTVGYSVGLGVQQLISAVPTILQIANIQGYQISNVDSGSINSTILLKLHAAIEKELAKPDVTGVVVTHGTDTLEETAFFLDLTLRTEKPVIIVGAMRPATALSADGPLNLVQAVTLAVAPNARGRGALITLNDRIGSAFYTTKGNANYLDTFKSIEAGQLGSFINQVPYFYFNPVRAIGYYYFNITGSTSLPMVDILYAYQDMDTKLFAESVENGAKGIVWAGVGAGGLSSKAYTAAATVYNTTNIPLVASHRTVEGFVPVDSDEVAWAIASGFYNPQKARILLQLAIATGHDREDIRSIFATSYPKVS